MLALKNSSGLNAFLSNHRVYLVQNLPISRSFGLLFIVTCYGQRSLAGYAHRVTKLWIRLK